MSYFHTRYDIVLRLFLPLLCLSCVWFSFRGSQPSPSRLWVLIIVEQRTQLRPLLVFISGRCSFIASFRLTDRPETSLSMHPPLLFKRPSYQFHSTSFAPLSSFFLPPHCDPTLRFSITLP
ncbi:hypothetical protein BJ165DRAFT_1519327 [Panaeolus papilionaceus]|nr:hypothetical protein BJ165DRAFT_1519327 [Panaeolus papilionaceus]